MLSQQREGLATGLLRRNRKLRVGDEIAHEKAPDRSRGQCRPSKGRQMD